jgi:enterochelin esterase-like enzyme
MLQWRRRNRWQHSLIGILAIVGTCWVGAVRARTQIAGDASPYESPTLQRLSQALREGRPGVLDDFWARVKGQVPLIEPIDGQRDFRWVTFLWRGDATTREVSVGVGDIPTPDPRKWSFRRLGVTDVWFKTDRAPKDARFTYLLRVNGGPLQPDPLNDRRFGGRSVAESPHAAPQPWIVERPDTPKGQLTPHTLQSRVLGEERSIGVYTPAGYSARGPHLALVIVFDGEMYGNGADALIPTPRVLDNLHAAKRIPATVAVLVNNMSQDARNRDLKCSVAFGDFLATELLPYVRARYRVTDDPSQVVLAGSSDGGLAALCAAHQHFKVFGNVLSQSANVFYSPASAVPANAYLRDSAWLTRKFVTTPLLPLRFYLEVGVLEAGLVNPVAEHRRLRDVLDAKGYHTVYSEFSGGHDFLTWQNSLGDGLIAVLAQERIKR